MKRLRTRTVRGCFPLALLALFLLPWAGCFHYHPVDQVDRDLVLAPILNRDGPPGLTGPLTRTLREKLAASPNWRLRSADSGAPVLRITLAATNREVIADDPADTGRPLAYLETVELRMHWDGAAPPWGGSGAERVLREKVQLFAQPSLIEARRSALPDVADRLARRVLMELEWSQYPAD